MFRATNFSNKKQKVKISAGAHEEEYELEDAINNDTNEEEHKEYTKDAFASCEKTKWSYSKENAAVLRSIYIDKCMLGKAKLLLKPTL